MTGLACSASRSGGLDRVRDPAAHARAPRQRARVADSDAPASDPGRERDARQSAECPRRRHPAEVPPGERVEALQLERDTSFGRMRRDRGKRGEPA